MWEHRTFDSKIFDVGKFTTLTPLLISCKLSFPIVGLKMSSIPTLALKSNKIPNPIPVLKTKAFKMKHEVKGLAMMYPLQLYFLLHTNLFEKFYKIVIVMLSS
jgi:hypothetical protein